MTTDAPSAAILAGGLATRFGGRDKSALLIEGRTILDRQLAALTPLTDDLMIVGHTPQSFQRSGRTGEAHAPGPGARVVPDLMTWCGPLGGLHAALSAARGQPRTLVACDMPYLSTPFIAHLRSLAGGADIVVPMSERGYHPLSAVYTRACLAPAEARLATGRLKMRDLLDTLRTCVVPVEDIRRFGDPDRLLANVNTPADYADLEALQGHKL